ncbi:hypothetical protein QAD02_005106, partial [Eretmocerus hayati]
FQENNGPVAPESLFPLDTDECLATNGLDPETMIKKYGDIYTSKYDMEDDDFRCYAACTEVEDLRKEVSGVLNGTSNIFNGTEQYDEELNQFVHDAFYGCSTI